MLVSLALSPLSAAAHMGGPNVQALLRWASRAEDYLGVFADKAGRRQGRTLPEGTDAIQFSLAAIVRGGPRSGLRLASILESCRARELPTQVLQWREQAALLAWLESALPQGLIALLDLHLPLPEDERRTGPLLLSALGFCQAQLTALQEGLQAADPGTAQGIKSARRRWEILIQRLLAPQIEALEERRRVPLELADAYLGALLLLDALEGAVVPRREGCGPAPAPSLRGQPRLDEFERAIDRLQVLWLAAEAELTDLAGRSYPSLPALQSAFDRLQALSGPLKAAMDAAERHWRALAPGISDPVQALPVGVTTLTLTANRQEIDAALGKAEARIFQAEQALPVVATPPPLPPILPRLGPPGLSRLGTFFLYTCPEILFALDPSVFQQTVSEGPQAFTIHVLQNFMDLLLTQVETISRKDSLPPELRKSIIHGYREVFYKMRAALHPTVNLPQLYRSDIRVCAIGFIFYFCRDLAGRILDRMQQAIPLASIDACIREAQRRNPRLKKVQTEFTAGFSGESPDAAQVTAWRQRPYSEADLRRIFYLGYFDAMLTAAGAAEERPGDLLQNLAAVLGGDQASSEPGTWELAVMQAWRRESGEGAAGRWQRRLARWREHARFLFDARSGETFCVEGQKQQRAVETFLNDQRRAGTLKVKDGLTGRRCTVQSGQLGFRWFRLAELPEEHPYQSLYRALERRVGSDTALLRLLELCYEDRESDPIFWQEAMAFLIQAGLAGAEGGETDDRLAQWVTQLDPDSILTRSRTIAALVGRVLRSIPGAHEPVSPLAGLPKDWDGWLDLGRTQLTWPESIRPVGRASETEEAVILVSKGAPPAILRVAEAMQAVFADGRPILVDK